MILLFDTETTGLPMGVPVTDPRYPKVVQLGWICLSMDLDVLCEQQLLVDPGVSIPTGASQVHGITTEVAQMCGTASKSAMRTFLSVASKADIVVGHNVKYDDGLIEHEMYRHGLLQTAPYQYFATASRVDTCDRRLLGLPAGKSVKVKLGEAYQSICGTALSDAHNALADCRAVYHLLRHACRLGKLDLSKLQADAVARAEAIVA